MIPSDYVKQFQKEGSDLAAITKAIQGMYAEKLAEIKAKNRKMTILDLEALELSFQAFRRRAEMLSDGTPISPKTFRLVIQRSMPEAFEQWNKHHKGQLLAD